MVGVDDGPDKTQAQAQSSLGATLIPPVKPAPYFGAFFFGDSEPRVSDIDMNFLNEFKREGTQFCLLSSPICLHKVEFLQEAECYLYLGSGVG